MAKKFNFQNLQQLGRALMLPIAVLPVAGILLRFGQPDLLNIKAIADAGNAIFANLPLLFAVGVALGFAKKNHGAAALAAVVGFFIMNSVINTIDTGVNTGVLGGIVIGIVAGMLYNRFYEIKLPEYLAFFGGKRFVPIITGLTAVLLGFLFGYIWPLIQEGINAFGNWLIGSGSIGLFLYGVFNRILLMFGLHHILNNLVWFQFGSFHGAAGIVHGDIARFMAGDPTAGAFMAGFFPIMMFGLPAACFAMYRHAHSHKQKAVAGMLFSIALTAFLTGVTEPIEYSFMFLAPVLYLIHALLTGISMVVMYVLGVKLGFTFSAGLIDYVLFFKMDTHPWLLLPVGAVTAVVYYFLFSFFIKKFNLLTIGREVDEVVEEDEKDEKEASQLTDSRALNFIGALGGKNNLDNIDACTTRLRLQVKDSSHINQALLKKLGARGIVVPDSKTVQVILGPEADLIAGEMNEALPHSADISFMSTARDKTSNHTETTAKTIKTVTEQTKCYDIDAIISALGGNDNIVNVSMCSLTRLDIELKTADKVNSSTLFALGIDGCITLDKHLVQLLVMQSPEMLLTELNAVSSH
ncbi:N-acetylglucosamine-specific PTS transporter subunit IIBC [Cysteiniphilum sp. QT6929]|uniref:N-acetylglucosamine-specific PTS transporter subunit IIBC n=1 Tax=Cysteiniphilum sp. QT6929 TaxID=2975055 RepID=UPI0024B33358|nr:N-acetylglucosamine-specific PTS transporter subunit IIBC [Cysteiniphilum sp. QT6929]WHN66070.1 N-acetylglucosamine-specific PTS transporter subunit IIBC [Cysteiniphilum sp. QT6929]